MQTRQVVSSKMSQQHRGVGKGLRRAGQSVIPAGKLADVYGSRHGMSRTHLNFYFINEINNLAVNVFFASNAVLRYVRSFLPQNQR
jgi:hypothetical protein